MDKVKMKTLFDKTILGGIEVENRFVRSATWENMTTDKGQLTAELIDLYADLAKGGAGLLITGYAAVMGNEQPNPKMMRLPDDSAIDEYKKLTDMVHEHGSKIVLQIAYGGSQTDYNIGEREIWGPSAVAEIGTGVIPREMTREDISELVAAFDKIVNVNFKGAYFSVKYAAPYLNQTRWINE
jgi:2,4-dienoyl-CoA reductase-like NADH-dependent reductase (Old Yellow Enzyme family)